MVATTLDVVNDCLAIMGEAPLNTILEDHAFKTAAINVLDRNNRDVQALGWWFNQEDLKLTVNPTDNRIYLPNDAATVLVDDRIHRDFYAQRGRVMYNLTQGTDMYDVGFTLNVTLTRQLAFEDLPNSANAYIGRKTVLDFQNEYDGDQTKTRNLQGEVYGMPGSAYAQTTKGLKGELMAEHIRNKRVNFINQSERLSRVTNRVNYSRRPR